MASKVLLVISLVELAFRSEVLSFCPHCLNASLFRLVISEDFVLQSIKAGQLVDDAPYVLTSASSNAPKKVIEPSFWCSVECIDSHMMPVSRICSLTRRNS